MFRRKRIYGGYVGKYAKKTGAKRRKVFPMGKRISFGRFPRGRGLRGETKYIDIPYASYHAGANAAVAVTQICLIEAGSSVFNRIGRKVALQNVQMHGYCSNISAGAAAVESMRLMIVYDAQANGANAIISDVIQATDQTGATSSTVDDGFNLNNRDRFRVILDKRFFMPSVSAAVADLQPNATMADLRVDEFRKLGRLEQQYKADSAPAVIGDLATGALFFICFGSVGGINAFNGTFRIRYTDI